MALIRSARNVQLVDLANRLGEMTDEYAEIMGEDADSTRAWHMLSAAFDDVTRVLRGECMTDEEMVTEIHCPE